MHKLSHQINNEWVEYSFAPIFMEQTTNTGNKRLVVGVPGGDSTVFTKLVGSLEPPYFLLYLLHTPRGEGEAGRYQSPELDSENFHAFLNRFSSFFSSDARHDIWAHSPSENATVVWNRHNLIYAYGPLQWFCSILRGLGFDEGTPNIPFPHQHHYRAEFDTDAAAVLSAFAWQHTPLRSEDEQ
jgi:hypothetical protein